MNYHKNARTTSYQRQFIYYSEKSTEELARKFNLTRNTVKKWKEREDHKDRTSKPKNLHYRLSCIERQLICSIRKTTWMPLDGVVDMALQMFDNANRSNVYRTLRRNNLNRVPKEKRQQAKKFKEYDPGYLHIDVTYLPKIEGQKQYLFVAIDRATRLLYYEFYDNKSRHASTRFLKRCMEFFPFEITHVLTDNGWEFTNELIRTKKGEKKHCKSQFTQLCEKNDIDHRRIKPFTPQTNGMVERVNKTIKEATVKAIDYPSYIEMKKDFLKYLKYYNLTRRHGSLVKELKVRTPIEAVNTWYDLEKSIFKQNPLNFKQKLLHLNLSQWSQPPET